jgi:ABC-type glycerol-3-phosphate transport system permease component
MMKKILFITLISFLASCTITKRVHNPGWHVEWKLTHSSGKASEQLATSVSKTEVNTPNECISPQELDESPITSENLNFQENSTFSDQQDPQAVKTGEAIRVEQGAAKTSKLDDEKEDALSKKEEPGAKKVHPLAKAALISLILSLVTFGLGMLVAMVLARYALKKIKSDPEQWTGRKMALTVLIISSVLFVPLMLLILLISLSMNYSSGGWL